jgi:hypothetical protein
VVGVRHEVIGSVVVHNVVPYHRNTTVPVAPRGRPVSASVADEPCTTVAGVALAVKSVGALVIVSDVDAVEVE